MSGDPGVRRLQGQGQSRRGHPLPQHPRDFHQGSGDRGPVHRESDPADRPALPGGRGHLRQAGAGDHPGKGRSAAVGPGPAKRDQRDQRRDQPPPLKTDPLQKEPPLRQRGPSASGLSGGHPAGPGEGENGGEAGWEGEGKEKEEKEVKLPPFFYHKYPALKNRLCHRMREYNKTMDEIEMMEKNNQAIVIRPQKPLVVDRIEQNIKKLTDLYEEGYYCAEAVFSAVNL